jgi:hypothetical protein
LEVLPVERLTVESRNKVSEKETANAKKPEKIKISNPTTASES